MPQLLGQDYDKLVFNKDKIKLQAYTEKAFEGKKTYKTLLTFSFPDVSVGDIIVGHFLPAFGDRTADGFQHHVQ